MSKFYYSVTYSIDHKGEPERANVWFESKEHLRPDENGSHYFRKNFSGENEKEVKKAAEAFAKAHNKILYAKAKAAKAEKVALKEAKKAEKVAKKEAVESRIKSFVSPEIKKIVAMLFEKQKENVLESLTQQYNHIVNLLKEIEGVSPKEKKYRDLLEIGYLGRTMANIIADRAMEHKMKKEDKPLSTWNPFHAPLFFKPGYKKIVERMIQNDLEAIMMAFLSKMEAKLGEVIKGKEILSFDSKGLHDGRVHFIFKDGSEFLLSNSIEYGISKYNVSFQRFPCRFHDVQFTNGKTEKWVSEEQMKKEF